MLDFKSSPTDTAENSISNLLNQDLDRSVETLQTSFARFRNELSTYENQQNIRGRDIKSLIALSDKLVEGLGRIIDKWIFVDDRLRNLEDDEQTTLLKAINHLVINVVNARRFLLYSYKKVPTQENIGLLIKSLKEYLVLEVVLKYLRIQFPDSLGINFVDLISDINSIAKSLGVALIYNHKALDIVVKTNNYLLFFLCIYEIIITNPNKHNARMSQLTFNHHEDDVYILTVRDNGLADVDNIHSTKLGLNLVEKAGMRVLKQGQLADDSGYEISIAIPMPNIVKFEPIRELPAAV